MGKWSDRRKMSEFDTPAEYHVLMAQKAFQLIRRGDQTRDKNKREISHLVSLFYSDVTF